VTEPLLERTLALPALNALLAERRRNGRVRASHVRQMAEVFGVGTSTVYRWLQEGRVPDFARPRYVATEEDLDAFFEARGSFRAAWRKRRTQPDWLVSYDTYRRAVSRSLGPALRAYAAEGRRAAKQATLQIPQTIPERNFLWVIDHKQLDTPVMASPYHRKPGYPWLTSVVDVYSRAILGWVLSMRPARGEVVIALAEACTSSHERGPFAGGPLNIMHDTGPELNAQITTAACVLLGADALPRRAWDPEPFIERFHRTIDQEFQIDLPFCRLGPKRPDGTVYGPDCDPLPLTALRDQWQAYVRHFNLERVHRSLGCTPAERFLADETPLRAVSENDIRLLRVERKHTRPITHEGIEIFRGHYIHPDQNDHLGEIVEIGEWPNDDARIDAFIGGQYLFTAIRSDQAPPELLAQALQTRNTLLQEGAMRMQRTSRRQRVRLRALHAGNAAPVITNAMTEEQARAHRQATGRIDLDAPSDVLGMRGRLNRPNDDP
jgi:transposase InsO family protein